MTQAINNLVAERRRVAIARTLPWLAFVIGGFVLSFLVAYIAPESSINAYRDAVLAGPLSPLQTAFARCSYSIEQLRVMSAQSGAAAVCVTPAIFILHWYFTAPWRDLRETAKAELALAPENVGLQVWTRRTFKWLMLVGVIAMALFPFVVLSGRLGLRRLARRAHNCLTEFSISVPLCLSVFSFAVMIVLFVSLAQAATAWASQLRQATPT